MVTAVGEVHHERMYLLDKEARRTLSRMVQIIPLTISAGFPMRCASIPEPQIAVGDGGHGAMG